MKLPKTLLLIPALVALGIVGCGTQSISPVAGSSGTKSAVETPPKPTPDPISPSETIPPKSAVVQAIHKTESASENSPSPASESATSATETPSPEPPTVPDSAAARPKADREPTKPGDPEKITFDDLILGMQADMVFRPFMLTDRAKELEGKRVRLTGDMLPYDGTKVKEFILLRNNKCLYGKGGMADHLALIHLREGHTMAYTSNTVRIEGKLRIEPVSGEDGNTKHLYVLDDAVAK